MGSCALRDVANICYILFFSCWLCFMYKLKQMSWAVYFLIWERRGVLNIVIILYIFWRIVEITLHLKQVRFAMNCKFSREWVHSADSDWHPWQFWMCTEQLCLYCAALRSQRAKLLTTQFKQSFWTLCFQYKKNHSGGGDPTCENKITMLSSKWSCALHCLEAVWIYPTICCLGQFYTAWGFWLCNHLQFLDFVSA